MAAKERREPKEIAMCRSASIEKADLLGDGPAAPEGSHFALFALFCGH
jgi:hypothetical protein